MKCGEFIEFGIFKKGDRRSKEEEKRQAKMARKNEKESERNRVGRYENVEIEGKQGERNFLLSDLTEICLNDWW